MSRPGPMLLGELERAVLDQLWTRGAQDVKACHRSVGRSRHITLNTIQSTMERLFRKGLLRRDKVSHAYVYEAVVSREESGARLARDVLASIVGASEPTSLLVAFVDLAERAGDDTLERMERLIAARRRGRP